MTIKIVLIRLFSAAHQRLIITNYNCCCWWWWWCESCWL